MNIDPDPDEIARIRAQAIASATEFCAKISALGIPFICIVGIPGDPIETLRLSRGLEVPEVNLRMRLEVERYALFMEEEDDER